MPDAPTKSLAAAEEVFNLIKSRLEEQLPFLQFHEAPQNDLSQIAAIFERHCGEGEKTLQAAAKWAAFFLPGGCPQKFYCNVCKKETPECYKNATQCWLEYWKKETKG